MANSQEANLQNDIAWFRTTICLFANKSVFSYLKLPPMERPLTVSDLLDNASRLDSRDFESFYKALLTLRARRIAPVLSLKETDLLEKIYQKLPSETSERYDLLTNKRREDNITSAEY